MRKIFLSAGHSNVAGKDRGAVGNGFIEGELTADLRNRIVHALRTHHGVIPITDSNDSVLTQTLAWIKNKTTNDCICLDIHWNAAVPAAKGVECFVAEDASVFEVNLAERLSQVVSEGIGTTLRGNFRGRKGVKSEVESQHKRLGWFRFTGEQVLLEVCFITNKVEMDAYIANRDRVAGKIAEVLAGFAKKK